MSTAMLKSASAENVPESLGNVFLKLQQTGKSGTLRLSGPDARVKYVYFRNGVVELLKTQRSRTLLGRALIKKRMLTDQQLQAALERQAAGGHQLRLGQILIGMGIIPADQLENALKYQIAEEVLELFTWATLKWDFIRGDPPLDVFEAEDLQSRVALEPKKLVDQAEKRRTELEVIRRTVPSMADVYVPTADAAMRYKQRPDAGAEREVISCADGERDVQEILDEVRTTDLMALRAIANMVQAGDVAPVAPAQLMALGQDAEDRQLYERARRRYLRAEELGHQDFDLPRKVGQLDEILGDLLLACRRYVAYAERCAAVNYPDVAAATLQRVLDLATAPGTPAPLKGTAREARTRLAAILEKTGRMEEASQEYVKLLADLPQDSPADERIRAISSILQVSDRPDLREQLAELYVQQGDGAEAIMQLQDVAAGALAEKQYDKAISVLEKILKIDPGEIMTQMQLASAFANSGRKDRAIAAYLKTVEQINVSGLATASTNTLVKIYERVVELDPMHAHARKWLAQAYDGKAQADKAVKNLSGMVEALRSAGKKDELVSALDKLCVYQPEDRGLALERARLKKELGKADEARAAFKSIADAALKAKEHEVAQEALSEVLAANPGDLESQLALAKVESQSDKAARAARRYGAVFEIAYLTGKLDLADEAVKRAIDIEPDAPSHRERTARLLHARSQPEEAARVLVKAARLARSEDDHGLARSWLKRALELDAGCEDAKDVLDQLKRAVSAAATVPQDGAAPAPVAPLPYQPSGSQRTKGVTITGGGQSSAQVYGVVSKKLGGIADRLKEIKGGNPAEGESMASRGDLYQPPPDANEGVVKQKAKAAMDRLRAIKGGGPGGAQPPHGSGPPPGSSDAAAPVPQGAPATPGGDAPAGTPGSKNEVADATIAKKASSAMDRLRAIKSGGPARPAEGAAPEVAKPSADLPAGTPGSANAMADPSIAKKASNAMDRLRALKGGGPGAAEATPTRTPSDDALAAIAAEMVPPPGEAAPPPPPPPPPTGEAQPGTRSLPRLPKPGAGADLPPGTPGSKNEVAAPELAKKANSAMDRLKAMSSLRGGPSPAASAPPPPGGAPPPPKASAPSSGGAPEAARAEGGVAPAGTPGSKNEVAAPELAKKANSAMARLKALKGGGDAPAPGAPAAMPDKISKGPEAPGEAADPTLSKKASSARDRLKAMRGGGASAPGAGPGAGQATNGTPGNGGTATAEAPGTEATA